MNSDELLELDKIPDNILIAGSGAIGMEWARIFSGLGKNVTIIGRSYNLSKPLASYLINKNSTVTMCHSKTKDLVSVLKNSDIVISATGVSNLFKSSDLKDECVVIDVGLGDVLIDSDTVSYTPRFKGIGPLSIACLLENLVTTCKDKK